MELLKKLKWYNVKKGLHYLKHFGVKEFLIRLQERMEPEEVPYGPWYEAYRPKETDLAAQRRKKFKHSCKFSIAVPAYETPETFLREMIASVQKQTYGNWELCIVNASPQNERMKQVLEEYAAADERIRVKNLAENKGIAGNTNEALAMASGDFVCLLDHDDLLAPNALFEAARSLEADSSIDVLYTDEDKVETDGRTHFKPNLKPDFNLDLLRSNNYICHFFMVRRALAERAGGFDGAYEGAQDYDFILRCTDMAKNIHHIPEILYHWRTHAASTADNPISKMYAYEAGKRAIEAHLERRGQAAEVSLKKDLGFYRVKYPVQGKPLVSIIIPNKDETEALRLCIESIKKTVVYENYEIIIVENNSSSREIFAYYKELSEDARIRIVRWKDAFNYSAINNYGVKYAKGEFLLFLNNDIEALETGWFEELLGNCQRPEVGITGAKLLYPDGTIQHAGTVIGIGGIAGHMFVGMPAERSGYLHKASLQMDYSAVTAACMMMKRSLFERLGGFEERLSVAFNDVDLCLRANEAGFLVVYDPYACLRHYESKSRGAEDSPEKVRRFQEEIEFMRTRWEKLLKAGDPYYNKNLSLSKWNYSLRADRKKGRNTND
ncbi:glycosyltransferase, group 2 family protein [Marvinbryantia formatexigens DSM 14469]|uniref:Glycosyltransferase, group 2 family protein n=1 Tax=Marvinbryantia formatexigens DSM 14469 TaxID=478749 RepID=C6LFR6_9FIRM|nr:glycosyltransferase family 2 protein [Marvinbryantia formatexigens]EET60651.1 glycosyltransferase, group 2 family protein [Marvinbryantia formatexigens DSM 14469]UWO25635.1 glycosyltransferase family 2 protein [Marvinbryantia formatexigens DSM 14469]SDG16449.1 Glycosyltransferase, GT2 family [Marvinbryantia formatexigens]